MKSSREKPKEKPKEKPMLRRAAEQSAPRVRGNEWNGRIARVLEKETRGASADRLAGLLRVKKKERARFLLQLSQMERRGGLRRDEGGRYFLPPRESAEARILSLQPGYAFARLTDREQDVFIPGRDLNGALPGDRVRLALRSGDERGPSGRVEAVEEPGGHLFTGRLTAAADGRMTVVPDSLIRYPLPVRRASAQAARPGDKVRFEAVLNHKDGELAARIVTSYGEANSARVCADAIVDAAGIPTEFPAEVTARAEELRDAGVTPADIEGRADLRSWTIFTIDGADAKDLDDAVSLEKTADGWTLGVHIADVSHYVAEGSALDAEAFRRGTSVYFADRVIPMLPEALSNGICSLNAGTDKLALSAVLTLDKQGNCTGAEVKKSVICSKVRGVYSEINAIFNGTANAEIEEKYAPVRETLSSMRTLAARLRERASRRGAMDLISSEPVFTLDGEGHPVAIHARTPGESEGMIEQFMIAANVAVAALARRRGLPFVYRVHENPDPDKLHTLRELAGRLGIKADRLESPLDLRGLMEGARETPYARLISDRILRSLAKARYAEQPLGHFGLAQADYCHFTSPIRRYPDLSIHRILSRMLEGQSREALAERFGGFARESAAQSSRCEVRAMTAERECESCYMAEYMGRFLGEEFEGEIAAISSFGMFIELDNAVEGLVRLESLPQRGLRFDEVASLTDARGRAVYTVGGRMDVRVVSTDVSSGRVDFEPAGKNG